MLRCSRGPRANPVPEACCLFEEEQRRKAKGCVWMQQTAPAPGLGSAQGLPSRPARALDAREQLERDGWPFPGEMTYGSNGWDSRLTGGSEIIHAVAGEKQNQLFREGVGVFRN